MLTQAPRGTKDVMPVESPKWHYIENHIRQICREFGFGEVRTPVFEHTELILRGVGETTDIVQKEMYTFLDKGNRSITLKPEGTAPAVRAFVEHATYAEAQPSKFYYISPIFRYEKPQAGRLREHHQFGIELFGSKEASADCEVIAVAMTFLKRLGIKNLSVNINSIGCPECRPKYNEALKEYFKGNFEELCGTCKDRFERNPLRIIDCKAPRCSEIAQGAPKIIDFLCDDCQNHFDNLKKELELLGIPFAIDPNIVRGLDYYTKTVFEIIYNEIGAQSTICGGGRYDKLISECGGPETPAVGFGLGLERLIITLESMGIMLPKVEGPDIYIVPIGDNAKMKASVLTMKLREEGFHAERDLMARSVKAQMKYADKINARYTLVIGDDEIEKGAGKLKNMATGEAVEVAFENLSQEMKKN